MVQLIHKVNQSLGDALKVSEMPAKQRISMSTEDKGKWDLFGCNFVARCNYSEDTLKKNMGCISLQK